MRLILFSILCSTLVAGLCRAELPATTQSATTQTATLLIPGINIELVRIPAGKFMVGSPRSDHDRYTDEPTPTQVTLTHDYWMARTLVTQRQWQMLMGGNPSKFTQVGPDAPVEQVSWQDAMDFCGKLTALEAGAGRLPAGYIYTLPTETQWECACRAGSTTPYAGDLDEMAWYASNAGITTHAVAQKKPNAWGLYDMHGNVWEWTSTRYNSSMLGGTGGIDPAGPDAGPLRVLRGGAFNMPQVPARSSYRFHLPPETKRFSIGFRVALTVPSRPETARTGLAGRGGRGRRGAQSQPAATQHVADGVAPAPQINDADVAANDANVDPLEPAALPAPSTRPAAKAGE